MSTRLSSLALLSLASVAEAQASGEVEWRAAIGAEVSPSSHGVFDLGVRSGPWKAELLTDTLDLRYQGTLENGRFELGVRGEFFAAGLMITPWTAGAPDPARARLALYGGVEGEYVRYLGSGLYARAGATLREWFFVEIDTTTIPLRDPTLIFSPELTVGWWTADAELTLTGGADLGQNSAAPRGRLFGRWSPRWIVGPRVELRAGLAHDQDDITRTRVGGLNPYVVPVAGLVWSEFWVERYIAVRAGPRLILGPVEAAVLGDFAWIEDGQRLVGLAAMARLDLDRWFLEAQLGYAAEVPRQPGFGRVAGWLLLGRTWGPW